MDMFNAVVVNGGRKFRGEAYRVPGEYISSWGYHNSGVAPYQETTQVKVWDPKSQSFYYVNERFVEAREVSDEQFNADWAAFAAQTIKSTMAWCRSKSAGKSEEEVVKFCFNVLRKNHPEMLDTFSETYGYKEDVAATIKSTVAWAMGLGYRKNKASRIAWRALAKKGLTVKEEFAKEFTKALEDAGAGKYADELVAAAKIYGTSLVA